MLRVKFRNGSSKVFKDRPDECEGDLSHRKCIKYKLSGYFEQYGLILIEIGRYEGVEWMLVWLDNGRESKIVAPPHYSPDRKWLAAACWSDGPAGCDNGIDIVPTTSGQAARDWHFRIGSGQEYLLLDFVKWESSDRLELAATFHDDENTAELKTEPAVVERINGVWQLKLPGDYKPNR